MIPGRAVLVLSFITIVFGALWAVVRFDLAWGEFHWMQRAYDEPYYLRQLLDGDAMLSHRLFSRLLGVVLSHLGVSFGGMAEAYALVMPPIVFALALLLAKTWETDMLKRTIWALLLVFSFDLLSGSNWVVYQDMPIENLAAAIGDPGLFKPDAMDFFIVYRRPEPQSSWLFLFPYLAGLIASFTTWRPRLYRIVCVATPFLAFVYINVAIIALIVFGFLSVVSAVVYRRPMILAFALSLAATLATFAAVFLGATAASVADRSVFITHLPILRLSIGFSLVGLAVLAFQIHRQRYSVSPSHWAALVFLCVPLVTLEQQILTGRAILPQNWECNGNYICIVIGIALLLPRSRPASSGEQSALARFAPIAIWLVLILVVLRGTLNNERMYATANAESVAYAKVFRAAETKVGTIDKVVLPHLWDESMFVTRVPRNVVVLGGYNWIIANWLPVWTNDKPFEAYAAEAKSNFDVGFETLARRGVTVDQFRAGMEAEIRADNCWPTLMYFFSLQDCWPTFSNYTSSALPRLHSATAPLAAMYARYLKSVPRVTPSGQVLLISKEPVGRDEAYSPFHNELVATMETLVRDIPVRAFAYLQSLR